MYECTYISIYKCLAQKFSKFAFVCTCVWVCEHLCKTRPVPLVNFLLNFFLPPLFVCVFVHTLQIQLLKSFDIFSGSSYRGHLVVRNHLQVDKFTNLVST